MKKSRFFTLGVFILAVGLVQAFSRPLSEETVAGELGQTLDRYMKRAEANGYSGSVLAARGEEVILAKGYGWADRENKVPETESTVFSIGSITKQFTGAAVLKLEAAGKLSTSDALAKYFPDAPHDKAKITLHQLLTHTAGFADALGDDYEPIGREDFVKRAMSSKLRFAPGARYQYSNVGFSLLGIIVELVSGKGYEEYLRANLFQPAGMTRTGYLKPGFDKKDLAVGYRNDSRWGTALDRPWRPEGPGWHLRANGGILSTVGDMHRWYLALKNNRIFPQAVRAKYFAPHVREYPDGPSYYGYGWVTQKTESGSTLVWHNGGNGIYNAFMGFDLDNDLVVIVSSNVSGKISDGYAERILGMMTGRVKPLDERTLAGKVGTYRFETGEEVAVAFDENDTLNITYTAASLVSLLAGSGKEKADETSACDVKARTMIAGALAGDYAALASAWGEPLEEVKVRAVQYWGRMVKNLGQVKAVEALGTADRPRNWLTYVRADFASGSRFFTCVWEKDGGLMADLREAGSLERDFKPRTENEFVQPLIDAVVAFGPDAAGKTVLTIRKGGNPILRATKMSSS
ncbi:MAG: beta-lactamase family protein [Candidatus Aminicenantes bacterium]|nr:beta-lactamase family protein [Candidatus Aminicenantes bacterium]